MHDRRLAASLAAFAATGCLLLVGVAAPALGGTRHAGPPRASIVGESVALGRAQDRFDCGVGANPDRRCSPGAYYAKATKTVICAHGFQPTSLLYVPGSEANVVMGEYGL